MSKGILEFNLDKPEDVEEFKRASNATNLCGFIWTYQMEVLRKAYKYNSLDGIEGELSEEQQKIVSLLSDAYYKLLDEYDINLDSMYS